MKWEKKGSLTFHGEGALINIRIEMCQRQWLFPHFLCVLTPSWLHLQQGGVLIQGEISRNAELKEQTLFPVKFESSRSDPCSKNKQMAIKSKLWRLSSRSFYSLWVEFDGFVAQWKFLQKINDSFLLLRRCWEKLRQLPADIYIYSFFFCCNALIIFSPYGLIR